MGSRNGNNDAVCSPLLIEETISTKRRKRLTETLTSPPPQYTLPLPTLSFDLILEILCRLPVMFLLRFRCVCKSWNSLIYDPKFAKKHLRFSTTRLVHTFNGSFRPGNHVLESYTLDSIFNDGVTYNKIAQLDIPSNPYINHHVKFVGSCNGILCLVENFEGYFNVQLCNPSIKKLKELPTLEKKENLRHYLMMYGFGYDAITNNYKVVVVLQLRHSCGKSFENPKVKVHTLGTNSWKSFEKFPFGCLVMHGSGKFVSGTINWLVSNKYDKKRRCFIASLDLGNESYQKIIPPHHGEVGTNTLHVLRDCLCMVVGYDVWVMKEYRNEESWTKLFTIRDVFRGIIYKVVNIFEDDQVLLESIRGDDLYTYRWSIYNSKNRNFKYAIGKSINIVEGCAESLISPCC